MEDNKKAQDQFTRDLLAIMDMATEHGKNLENGCGVDIFEQHLLKTANAAMDFVSKWSSRNV